MLKRIFYRGRFSVKENMGFILRDSHGNIKKLFSLNFIGKLLKKIGLNVPNIALFGSYVSELRLSNLVVDAGKAGVASRVNGAGAEAAFTYIAIGTGTTAAAAGDTALEAEITTNGGQRAAATASRVTTDVANDTARNVVTFTFTGNFAITESGVFNAASAGVMLARNVFAAINVTSGDSLQITWSFDID